MKILISELRNSPDWHSKMSAGKVSGDGFWLILPQDEKQPAAISPNQSKPRKWPLWARAIRLFAKNGEIGVGDTLARLLGYVGGEWAKRWIKRITGRGCKCHTRQAGLNVSWPYKQPANSGQTPFWPSAAHAQTLNSRSLDG